MTPRHRCVPSVRKRRIGSPAFIVVAVWHRPSTKALRQGDGKSIIAGLALGRHTSALPNAASLRRANRPM
jgi:hypothetical protein